MKRLGLAAVLLLGVLLPASAAATQNPSLWWWKDGDRVSSTVTPPVTRAKLQTILDQANDTTHLYVQLGPGELWADSTIWVHGNTSLYGMGPGITRFRRSYWNPSGPVNSGHLLTTAKYRTHSPNNNLTGGLAVDSLANVELVGFTLDGRCEDHKAIYGVDVNPNTPGNFGIQLWHAERVAIRYVEVMNTLQTGIELDACRDATLDHVRTRTTGQQTQLGTRNGININNNDGSLAATVNWGRRIHLSNIEIRNARGAQIDYANVSEITATNITMHCDNDPVGNQGPPTQDGNFAFEIEGSVAGYTMRGFTISNVVCTGLTHRFLTFGGTTVVGLDGFRVDNVDFTASDSSFSGALAFGSSRDVRNVDISNCTFRNLNARNVDGTGTWASAAFIYAYTTRATGYERHFRLKNLTFLGAHGETRHTSNPGLILGGNVYDFVIEDVYMSGCEDVGVKIVSDSSWVTTGVVLRRVTIDGAQSNGFLVTPQSGSTGVINGVRFEGCVAKDTNLTPGTTWPFRVTASGASFAGTAKNIWFDRCQVVRSSGANMEGLRLDQSSTGVLDSVWVLDNDFDAAVTQPYSTSGAVTNLFRSDVTGSTRYLSTALAMENNKWMYFRGTSATYWPFMKFDSVGVFQVRPPQNGSGVIDFYRWDGTPTFRYYGNTGSINLYNTGAGASVAKMLVNGYPYLYDSGNERRLVQKSSIGNGTTGIAIRDTADAKTEVLFYPGGGVRAARLGPVGGGAIRIIDGIVYPFTPAGVQAAIDSCSAFGGGTVWIPDNANVVLASTPIVLKNKVALKSFGSKTHDSGTVFKANGSTNVPFAIVAGDTAGGQQLFQLDGITIDGTGGRIDWGIYSKLNFVGSKIENCRVTKTGIGIGIIGANATSIGSFMVRNTIVNDMTSSYCILQDGGSRNVVYDGIELDRPGRNTAALYVNGSSTSSAGSITTTIRNSYGELSDSMSVWLKVNGAAAVEVDGLHVTHPTGRFRAAVEIQNTVPGNFGFSPSGFTLRNLYADSDTLIVNQPIGEYITTGSDFNNPYRHVSWYSPSLSIGSASTNGYRNSNMTVGMQPARVGPAIASAATIVPPPDGSVFGLTGVTGITDVTFLDSFMGKIVVFVSSSGPLTITAGNHWKINGNWTANGTGNWDTLTGYVTAGHDFIEIGRCIQ